jgi:hypothetical protein
MWHIKFPSFFLNPIPTDLQWCVAIAFYNNWIVPQDLYPIFNQSAWLPEMFIISFYFSDTKQLKRTLGEWESKTKTLQIWVYGLFYCCRDIFSIRYTAISTLHTSYPKLNFFSFCTMNAKSNMTHQELATRSFRIISMIIFKLSKCVDLYIQLKMA